MYRQTTRQTTHGEMILNEIKNRWMHSADLVEITGTRNLQARISGLENDGWVISRRASTDHRDGVEYRAVRHDPARSRTSQPKQIHVKVPEGCPADAIERAKKEAARVMQEAVAEAGACAAADDDPFGIQAFFDLISE